MLGKQADSPKRHRSPSSGRQRLLHLYCRCSLLLLAAGPEDVNEVEQRLWIPWHLGTHLPQGHANFSHIFLEGVPPARCTKAPQVTGQSICDLLVNMLDLVASLEVDDHQFEIFKSLVLRAKIHGFQVNAQGALTANGPCPGERRWTSCRRPEL